VTQPFHPLHGRDFEFVAYRQNWGEDRVHLHDEYGHLFSVPAGWTDVAAADPFVVIAVGADNLCHLGRCTAERGLAPSAGRAGFGVGGRGMIFDSWA